MNFRAHDSGDPTPSGPRLARDRLTAATCSMGNDAVPAGTADPPTFRRLVNALGAVLQDSVWGMTAILWQGSDRVGGRRVALWRKRARGNLPAEFRDRE